MSEPKIELDFTDALRAFGLDPDDPRAFEHVIDVRTQDEKDGASLRRLREALLQRGLRLLTSYAIEAFMTTGGTWRVSVLDAGRNMGTVANHHGTDLAEAADACREALG